MKRVILCADDYSYCPQVSAGIVSLLEKQRLSAVGCMTNRPSWKGCSKRLRDFQGQIDIGLHLNLTEGPFLSQRMARVGRPLKAMLLSSFLRRLDPEAIEKELTQQIDAFSQHMGCLPDFIDGHEHVHQLPVVRDIVCDVYKRYFIDRSAYIRVSTNPWKTTVCVQRSLKGWVIGVLGGWRLKSLLEAHRIPHNTSFSGIYGLKPGSDYRTLFQGFLKHVNDGGLLIVISFDS